MKKKLKKKKISPTGEGVFERVKPFIGAAIVGGVLVGVLSNCEVKKAPLKNIPSQRAEEITGTIRKICDAARKTCDANDAIIKQAPVKPARAIAPVKHITVKKKVVKKKQSRKHYAAKPCNCICMPRIFARG